MPRTSLRKAIIGYGGFAREVASRNPVHRFFVDDKYYTGLEGNVSPLSQFDPSVYRVVIAIGDPSVRQQIVDQLPKETVFYNIINTDVDLRNLNIGVGNIICPGTQITTDVSLGNHNIINLNCTVGHDTQIKDFCTASPGVNISGNVLIGNRVYLGTGSSIREGIDIIDDVTVGMGAAVVKSLYATGRYLGVPAKLYQG